MINVIPLPSDTADWIINLEFVPKAYQSILTFIAKLTLHSVSRFANQQVVLNIHFVSPKYSKFLNKKYRNKNYETNVLSFPADALPIEIEGIERELGDIFICKQVLEKEAYENNKSFLNHILHITVHGILHLVGYDHENLQDAKKMEQKEISILQKVGINNIYD